MPGLCFSETIWHFIFMIIIALIILIFHRDPLNQTVRWSDSEQRIPELHNHCQVIWHLHCLLIGHYYRNFLNQVSRTVFGLVPRYRQMGKICPRSPSFFRKARLFFVFLAVSPTIAQNASNFTVIPCYISTLKMISKYSQSWRSRHRSSIKAYGRTVESPLGEPIEVSEPPDAPDDVVVITPCQGFMD